MKIRKTHSISPLAICIRLNIATVMIFCVCVGIVIRLYNLQEAEYDKWDHLASRQHDTSINIHGARGSVLDRQGRPLSVSVQAVSLGAHPRSIDDIRITAIALSDLLDTPPSELHKKLEKDRTFTWLARGMPRSFGEKVKSLNLKGVSVIRKFRRY